MGTTVLIEEKAFMGILLSAVEAFPSKFYGERKPKGATAEGEVHGLLFGPRIQRRDSAETSEKDEPYGAVDNLICTTAAGVQSFDFFKV